MVPNAQGYTEASDVFYRFQTGKAPRGKRLWSFRIATLTGVQRASYTVPEPMSYREAQALAVREAHALGGHWVEVNP